MLGTLKPNGDVLQFSQDIFFYQFKLFRQFYDMDKWTVAILSFQPPTLPARSLPLPTNLIVTHMISWVCLCDHLFEAILWGMASQ